MKTKGSPCKIGAKQTGFCAEIDTNFAKKSRFFVLFERWERILAHASSSTLA
jgi:hypothetical protein